MELTRLGMALDTAHQLTPHLKQLRLSGVLETLEARNRQAIDGKWTYVEFLSRLLEDEVERRAQKQLALRLRRGSVNTNKSLESFNFDFNPVINRQRVLQLASGTLMLTLAGAMVFTPTALESLSGTLVVFAVAAGVVGVALLVEWVRSTHRHPQRRPA